MEFGWIPLRRSVSPALLGNYMNQHGMVQFLRFPQGPFKCLDIVAVHRSQIGDSHVFKQHPWDQKLFDPVLGPADLIYELVSYDRNA